MRFVELLEGMTEREVENTTWYHGSKTAFDSFDAMRSAEGNTQEGPGFYLTTDPDDAAKYGDVIMTFAVNVRELLPTKGRPSKAKIRSMILASPELDEALTDWDEDRNTALKLAVETIANSSSSPKDAFERVWASFYRNSPAAWLSYMWGKLGYTGFVLDRPNGIKHFICFNEYALTRKS